MSRPRQRGHRAPFPCHPGCPAWTLFAQQCHHPGLPLCASGGPPSRLCPGRQPERSMPTRQRRHARRHQTGHSGALEQGAMQRRQARGGRRGRRLLAPGRLGRTPRLRRWQLQPPAPPLWGGWGPHLAGAMRRGCERRGWREQLVLHPPRPSLRLLLPTETRTTRKTRVRTRPEERLCRQAARHRLPQSCCWTGLLLQPHGASWWLRQHGGQSPRLGPRGR